MRTIIIKDKNILKILNKKSVFSKEANSILDKMKKLEAELKELEKKFNTVLIQTKSIDEKARPHLNKIIDKIEMEEFEQVSRVYQEEKTGDWYIEIADRLEEFKIAFKEQKEKELKEKNDRNNK